MPQKRNFFQRDRLIYTLLFVIQALQIQDFLICSFDNFLKISLGIISVVHQHG